MKVKCTSSKLRHVHFVAQGDGSMKAIRIRPGDTFEVKAIPAQWEGMVVPVEGGVTAAPEPGQKVAATASGTKAVSGSADAKKAS